VLRGRRRRDGDGEADAKELLVPRHPDGGSGLSARRAMRPRGGGGGLARHPLATPARHTAAPGDNGKIPWRKLP
jgi:hypothetical protein